MIENLAEVLGAHPFLEGFTPEHVEFISECAHHREYEQGEFLFREGMLANEFFLINDGRVAIEVFQPHGEPKILQTVHRGEFIGWSWMVEPYRFTFDALATQNTQAIMFDAERLRNRFNEDNALGFLVLQKFTRVISDRLNHTWLQLMDVYHQEQ